MKTPSEVVNLALSYLHLDEIISMDDDNERARAAKANWENCRRAFLLEHPWSFAKRTAGLVERPDSQFGWAHGYSCPSDFLAALRVVPADSPGFPGSLPFEIILGGNGDELILCADAENAALEYVSDRASLSLYSPLAIEALAHRLAFLIGNVLQNDQRVMQQLWQVYQMSLSAAVSRDAGNRTYPRLAADTYNNARIVASGWR